MSEMLEAVALFQDELDTANYFKSLGFERDRKELLNALNAPETPMIFVIGEPGSGKSFLLNYIKDQVSKIDIAAFYDFPNFTNRELLMLLLDRAGIDVDISSESLNSLLERLKKHFKNLENTICIDEAQHMNEKQLEFLRVLADQKIARFVLAMHKREGEYILSKDRFKSRPVKKIVTEPLSRDETLNYIHKQLLSNNFSTIAHMFDKPQVNLIYKFSKGNFRITKKLIRALLHIVHLADKAHLLEYNAVNEATVTMAAIDIGLIDVES